MTLRTVPPLVIAHTFCASRYIRLYVRDLPPNTIIFLVYNNVEKVDLSKGYQNLKRKLWVTMHFSEIIELKFEKKLPYILCILMLFSNFGCLIISEKMRGYPYFSFWIPITLAKIYFSPVLISFVKIHLY